MAVRARYPPGIPMTTVCAPAPSECALAPLPSALPASLAVEEEQQATALLCRSAIFQSSAVEGEQLLLQRSISLWRQMTVQISLECSLPLERQLSYLEWLMLNWNSIVLL